MYTTFQKSRGGARTHLEGANFPPPPLNETLNIYIMYFFACVVDLKNLYIGQIIIL